jgi:glycosyltransferase involved in cell wall biosynthesis
MNPWLTVVVPSYNQARFIERTLKSLFNQNEVGVEIILVDGGSTDGCVDVIRRYADKLSYWVSEPDHGQGHALNKGFARASGQWLTWLNSDDLLLPGALSALRARMRREPEVAWWIGGGWFIDAAGRNLRPYDAPTGLKQPSDLSDWRRCWFAQPGTLFTRDLYERAGGQVDESLHYAMDLDLWLRLLQHTSPGVLSEKLSGYRLHENAKTSVLTPKAEVEIIEVLMRSLGFDAVRDRVLVSAADREDFQRKLQRLESVIEPAMKLYRPIRKVWPSIRKLF